MSDNETPDETPDETLDHAEKVETAALPEPPENFDELVDQVVRLRDKIKAADDAHKQRTATARAYKERLEAKLLERLNSVGGDSIKTPHGTAYRTTRRNASIADGGAFREFVVSQNAFDLVDWRANAPAINDYIRANKSPPPGVNYSETYTVGVRRS